MLVLSRKKDETIVMTLPAGLPAGTRLSVTVVEIRGDKTRLAFDAPRLVTIHRSEVQERVDEAGVDLKRVAAKGGGR